MAAPEEPPADVLSRLPVSARPWLSYSHGMCVSGFDGATAAGWNTTVAPIARYFDIVATDSAGGVAFLNQSADGSAGATWAGVFSTSGGGITSITISSDVDFALGRFGYNLIPTPGALALLGLAGFAGRRRRA